MSLTLVWGLTIVFGSYDPSEVPTADVSQPQIPTTTKGIQKSLFLTPFTLKHQGFDLTCSHCLLRTRFCCHYGCPNELDCKAGLGSFGAVSRPRASKCSHLDFGEKSHYSYCSHCYSPHALWLHCVSGKNHKISNGITC